MRKLLHYSLAAFLMGYMAISLQAQTLVNLSWQDTIGHPLTTLPYQAATTDASGNFIIAGSTYTTGAGVSALLAKYNSAGTLLWETGGIDTITASYISVDVHNLGQ